MNKIRKILRYIIYIIELCLLYSLEQTSIFWFGFKGIKPMLIVIGFVCISLFETEEVNVVIGFLTGLLVDFSFGGIFGINAAILGVMGAALGVLFSRKLSVTALNALLISVIVSIIEMSLNLYLRPQLYGLVDVWHFWQTSFISYVLISAAVSVPIYFIIRTISYLTREKLDEYYKY